MKDKNGNNLTRIGIDIGDELLELVDNLKRKEKWSRSLLAKQALIYYLRLRGYREAK